MNSPSLLLVGLRHLPAMLLSGFLACAAAAREWTDTTGRSLTADIVDATGDSVTLRLPDGSRPVVKLAQLCEADRKFVADWRKSNAAVPIATAAPAAHTGFDGEWPDNAHVPDDLAIDVVKEDDADRVYVYRSAHFEFKSDVQLRPSLVGAFAKVFEATHEFLRLLPLNHSLTSRQGAWFPVELYEKYSDYLGAGGMKGSAGICTYRDGRYIVLVPLRSLGVKKVGRDYAIDAKSADWRTLSHEISHQLSGPVVQVAPWYAEGSAEYIGNTPYTGGRFRISTNRTEIVARVTGFGRDRSGGRGLGREIVMPDLKSFMTLTQSEFLKRANRNYGIACLLTYYFYHIDGEGDAARIKEYLKALQRGTDEPEARDLLLDGRSWDQLADDFAKGIRRAGVRIEYSSK